MTSCHHWWHSQYKWKNLFIILFSLFLFPVSIFLRAYSLTVILLMATERILVLVSSFSVAYGSGNGFPEEKELFHSSCFTGIFFWNIIKITFIIFSPVQQSFLYLLPQFSYLLLSVCNVLPRQNGQPKINKL